MTSPTEIIAPVELNFKSAYKVLMVMDVTVQYLDCGGGHISL